jgi:hypothetical protein
MSFPGIPPVAIYSRMAKGILLVAVCGFRSVRIFNVSYKRLGEITKFAWLFFLAELVSAQVSGQSNRNVALDCILPRSATS